MKAPLSTVAVLGLALGGAAVALGTVVIACGKTDAAAAMSGNPGSTPAPAGEKLAPAKTQAAKDGSWSAEIKPAAGYKTGQAATFEIVLKTSGDFHVNPDYPYKFTANDDKNVAYDKAEFPKDDPAYTLDKCSGDSSVNCTLHLTVKFTPKAKATVGGELKFGVCSKDKCKFDKAPLAIDIDPGANT